jgi:hypothetical protein
MFLDLCSYEKKLSQDRDIKSLLYLLYKSKDSAEYLLIQKIEEKVHLKYFICSYKPFNKEYSLKKISEKIFAGGDIDFLFSYEFQELYDKPLPEKIDTDLYKYIDQMFSSLYKEKLEEDKEILSSPKYRRSPRYMVEYHNTNHINIKLVNNDGTLLKRFPLVTISEPDDQYLERIEPEDFFTNFQRIHLFVRNHLKIPDEYELSRHRRTFFCLLCSSV